MFDWKFCKAALAAILSFAAISHAQSPDFDLVVDGVQLQGVAVERLEFDGSTLQLELDAESPELGVVVYPDPAPDPDPDPDPVPDPDPQPDPGRQFVYPDWQTHIGPFQQRDPIIPELGIYFKGGQRFDTPNNAWQGDLDIAHTNGGFWFDATDILINNHRSKTPHIGRFTRSESLDATNFDTAAFPRAQLEEWIPAGRDPNRRTSGVFQDPDGRVIITQNTQYDAEKNNDAFIRVVPANGFPGTPWYDVRKFKDEKYDWLQISVGTITKTPQYLLEAFGGQPYQIAPEHKLSIISRYGTGAGVYGWDGLFPPDTGRNSTQLTHYLHYPWKETKGEHLAHGTSRPAKPIFNRLSAYEVNVYIGDFMVSIGSNAGQGDGNWVYYGDVHPHTGRVKKGNHTKQRHPYMWVHRVSDILNGDTAYSTVPVEWNYFPFPIKGWVIGGFVDPDLREFALLTLDDGDPVLWFFGW